MTLRRATGSDVADLQDRRDRQCVERIAGGDEDAFAELFRRYGPVTLGLAARIVADRTLAEEVVQEVFTAVWRKAADHDAARGSVRTWIMTQVHHRAVDVVRREEAERRRGARSSGPSPERDPEDVVEEGWIAARRERVRAALGALPHEQRRMLELAYVDGLSQTQVAARAGIPLGTVKSRTLAAMRRLRAALVAEEGP